MSTDINLPVQDGWKDYYLCKACEQKLSEWENWFAQRIFYPRVSQDAGVFPYDASLYLFASSLHFRYARYVMDQNPGSTNPGAASLFEKARVVCRRDDITASSLFHYIVCLRPVDRLGRFPPGINTYFFMTIDGSIFDWVAGDGRTIWISYLKLPFFAFFMSDTDLRHATNRPELLRPHSIGATGTVEVEQQSGMPLLYVEDRCKEKAIEIQKNYLRMSETQQRKLFHKVQTAPRREESLAHQVYLWDKAMLEQRGKDSC
jgi:hypothetical protein